MRHVKFPDNVAAMSILYRFMYRIGFTPWDRVLPAELGEIVGALPPGRALDLGSGQGAKSVFLARHGWQVTAVENVPRAMAEARRRASDAGVAIDFRAGDVTRLSELNLSPGYSLVFDFGCYHGLNRKQRDAYGEGVNALAAPGAMLLLMGFTRAVPPVPWRATQRGEGAARRELRLDGAGLPGGDQRRVHADFGRQAALTLASGEPLHQIECRAFLVAVLEDGEVAAANPDGVSCVAGRKLLDTELRALQFCRQRGAGDGDGEFAAGKHRFHAGGVLLEHVGVDVPATEALILVHSVDRGALVDGRFRSVIAQERTARLPDPGGEARNGVGVVPARDAERRDLLGDLDRVQRVVERLPVAESVGGIDVELFENVGAVVDDASVDEPRDRSRLAGGPCLRDERTFAADALDLVG